MLKTLEILERVSKHDVDQIRRKVSKIQSDIKDLYEHKTALENRKIAEREYLSKNPEALRTQFYEWADSVIKESSEKIKILEYELDMVMDSLRDAYGELKKNEIMKNKLKEQKKFEDDKKEQEFFNEIGISKHNLKNQQ